MNLEKPAMAHMLQYNAEYYCHPSISFLFQLNQLLPPALAMTGLFTDSTILPFPEWFYGCNYTIMSNLRVIFLI